MTNEDDSDEILTQILMDLPEKGAGKPSSRTAGARQTNPQHHLQCRVCSEFWPYGAQRPDGKEVALRVLPADAGVRDLPRLGNSSDTGEVLRRSPQ
jgi:hypothetical protein